MFKNIETEDSNNQQLKEYGVTNKKVLGTKFKLLIPAEKGFTGNRGALLSGAKIFLINEMFLSKNRDRNDIVNNKEYKKIYSLIEELKKLKEDPDIVEFKKKMTKNFSKNMFTSPIVYPIDKTNQGFEYIKIDGFKNVEEEINNEHHENIFGNSIDYFDKLYENKYGQIGGRKTRRIKNIRKTKKSTRNKKQNSKLSKRRK
jgi:hypothetical protein